MHHGGGGRHLECLKQARINGCLWNEEAWNEEAWNEEACTMAAAVGGHLECLKRPVTMIIRPWNESKCTVHRGGVGRASRVPEVGL